MTVNTEEFIYSTRINGDGCQKEISAILKRNDEGQAQISLRMKAYYPTRGSWQRTIRMEHDEAQALADAINAALAS